MNLRALDPNVVVAFPQVRTYALSNFSFDIQGTKQLFPRIPAIRIYGSIFHDRDHQLQGCLFPGKIWSKSKPSA
jgi:hypothetical protein